MNKRAILLKWLPVAAIVAFSHNLVSEAAQKMDIQRLQRHAIPLISRPPAIDGRVDEREWIQAMRLPPLLNWHTGQVASDPTEVFVAYTAGRLFMGWRMHRKADAGPLLVKSTVPGRVEGRGIWKEDVAELFLDTDRTLTQSVNFAGNPAGAFGDGMCNPKLNAEPSWNWQYAARQTEAGWEGELSTAFRDLGVPRTPAPGTVWRFDFVRDNKTPERIADMLSFRSRWHDLSRHSELVFGGAVPAVRILEGGAIGEALVGVLAEVINPTSRHQTVAAEYEVYRLRSDSEQVNFLAQVDSGVTDGHTKEAGGFTMNTAEQQIEVLLDYYGLIDRGNRRIAVGPGERAALNLSTGDCPSGQYVIAYRFTSADGVVLSSAVLPATRWPPVSLEVVPYYLRRDVIHVKATAHSKELLDALTSNRCRLIQNDAQVVEKVVDREEALAGVDLDTKDIGIGAYTLSVEAMDQKGKVIARRRRDLHRPPPPDWAAHRYGLKPFVPPPWTPVKASRDSVEVWGRTYRFGNGILPQQIAVGDEPLLAAPSAVQLVVDGVDHSLRGRLERVSRDDEQVTLAWRGTAGSMPVQYMLRTEFDGFVTVDLDLDTQGRTVDRFIVELPIRSSFARMYTLHDWLHDPGPGEARPPAAGTVGGGFKTGFNFAVWIGDHARGLQWCAETDEHWNNRDRARAIEVVPDAAGESVALRLRVIDAPMRNVGKLSYRWGLVATPTKPRSAYRDLYYYHTSGFGEDLWASNRKQEGFRHTLAWARALGANWVGCHHWNSKFFGQPFLEDEADVEACRRAVDLMHEHGLKVALYAGWIAMHPKMKEWPFFGQAMTRTPKRFTRGGFKYCARSTFEDYLTGGAVWMVRNLGADGIYLDSTAWPGPCLDPHHGCGYFDPAKEERVPTATIWSAREMFKRLYKIYHGEIVQDGLIYSHTGQPPIMPIESFIDVKHCGEAAYSAQTLAEYYSLDAYQARFQGIQYGLAVEHTFNDTKALIARNAVWGVALLHDNAIKMYDNTVLPEKCRQMSYEPPSTMSWRMWVPRKWFDWSDSGFHPYYGNAQVLSVDADDVYASFHLNAKRQMLLYVANLAGRSVTANLQFDTDRLGLPTRMHGRDVVTNETLILQNGCISLQMPPERPRVLMFDTSWVRETAINAP